MLPNLYSEVLEWFPLVITNNLGTFDINRRSDLFIVPYRHSIDKIFFIEIFCNHPWLILNTKKIYWKIRLQIIYGREKETVLEKKTSLSYDCSSLTMMMMIDPNHHISNWKNVLISEQVTNYSRYVCNDIVWNNQ